MDEINEASSIKIHFQRSAYLVGENFWGLADKYIAKDDQVAKDFYIKMLNQHSSIARDVCTSIDLYLDVQRKFTNDRESNITRVPSNNEHTRLAFFAKSIFIWIRAYQDICARIILVFTKLRPGEKTSMSKHAKIEKPIGAYLNSNIPNYIEWFKCQTKIRNAIKNGDDFGSLSVSDMYMNLSVNIVESGIDIKYVFTLPELIKSIKMCDNLAKLIEPDFFEFVNS